MTNQNEIMEEPRTSVASVANLADRSDSIVKCAIVIPALNEEEAIGSTLDRALRARAEVVAATPIDELIIVFVNDGSTDRTQEIADEFDEVIKVRFERNRGYGAAIMAGFRATDAELVGFMDADGTCDPRFCAQLINRLYETDADIVLGARLHDQSEMPFVRRLGNRIFARLVGFVSKQTLTDSASGMRIIRRTSLRRMVPLPEGLHFTPAMSCIASLDPRLRIEEVPMPYKERLGRSKLSVIRDGIRFLLIILFASACFNPIISLTAFGVVFLGVGLVLSLTAMQFGASASVATWLAAAYVFVLFQAVFIGVVCHQLTFLLIGPRVIPGKLAELLDRYFWTKPLIITGAGTFLIGVALWATALLVEPPAQTMLWGASAIAAIVGGWSALGGVIFRVIWAARERQRADWDDPFALHTSDSRPSKHKPEHASVAAQPQTAPTGSDY